MKENNSRIRIWSVLAATLMMAPLPLAVSPATAEGEPPVSEHRVYVAEITNKGTPPSVATVEAAVDSALDRWEVESDGALSMTRVGGVAQFETATDCSSLSKIYAEARALPQFAGVDWKSSARNHLVVVTVPPCREDSKGSNPLGFTFERGGEVLYSYSEDDAQALFHEFGHNFGLGHATARVCDAAACRRSEYGNLYSPFGYSITTLPAYTHGGLDSFERSMLGLASPAEVQQLSLAADRRVRSAVVELRGRGTDAGLRGLQVTDPRDGATYFVDFRSGAGRDRLSYYGVKNPLRSTPWNRGITVQRMIDVGGRLHSEIQPVHTSADGVNHYALAAGQSYRTDSDADGQEIGMQIDVEAMQLTGSVDDVARVKVTLTDERVPLLQQTGSLSIAGRGGVGDTMTATASGWTEGSKLGDITWYANGVAIPGAVGATYVIPEQLQGHRLSARVTGTLESHADLTASSGEVVVGQGLQGSLVEGATYEIRSVETGRLLSDPGYKTGSLTQVAAQSAPAAGATGSQRWTVNSVGADGSFRLQNQGSSTGCLDNAASRTSVGNQTIEYSCHTSSNQRWTIVGSGYGYALVNLRSTMAVAPVTDSEGSLVAQSADAYAWRFVRVG